MDATTNSINWFEIPITDMNRAKKFYETVFGITMELQDMMKMQMAMFPSEMGSGKTSGSLCKSEYHKSSAEGVVIYLNANPDLQTALDKIENAGGKIIMPKTQITPEIGFMAFFKDTEGNHLALHSQH